MSKPNKIKIPPIFSINIPDSINETAVKNIDRVIKTATYEEYKQEVIMPIPNTKQNLTIEEVREEIIKKTTRGKFESLAWSRKP